MKNAGIVVLLLALMATLVTSSFAAAPEEGKKLFDAKCAVCHAADGAGKIKTAPDLRAAPVQSKSDADLAKFIAEGKGHGFAAKGLTADQITEVVAYIRMLKAK